ncbi:hypothetical protein [Lacrimispora sp.]|uniref:hypothetical protein n=1 Tax=Lacrimispora sp. TaxID=2719234 RepID=UPI003996AF6E
MLKNPEIENYIEINGEEIPMDSLSVERRKEIALMLDENIMKSAGLKRIAAQR